MKLKQFHKFSTICVVASIPLSEKKPALYPTADLFQILVSLAAKFFSIITQFFRDQELWFYKFFNRFILSHPWFGSYLIGFSCALLVFAAGVRGYLGVKKDLSKVVKLIATCAVVFFVLGSFFMSYYFFQQNGVAIGQWFYDLLLAFYAAIKEFLQFLKRNMLKSPTLNYPKPDEGIQLDENLKPPVSEVTSNKGPHVLDDKRLFLFYSLLTAVTLKFIFEKFKRTIDNIDKNDVLEGVIYDLMKFYGDNFNSKIPRLIQ